MQHSASSPAMVRSVTLSDVPIKLITPEKGPDFAGLELLLPVRRNLYFASALISSSEAPF
jgi:hypothetical protein